MFKKCSFNEKENKINCYKGKYCIERLCKKLKESSMEIIDYEKKEIMLLNDEKNNLYNEQEICYICGEKFCMDKHDKNHKNRKKVKDQDIIQDILEELPIVNVT